MCVDRIFYNSAIYFDHHFKTISFYPDGNLLILQLIKHSIENLFFAPKIKKIEFCWERFPRSSSSTRYDQNDTTRYNKYKVMQID